MNVPRPGPPALLALVLSAAPLAAQQVVPDTAAPAPGVADTTDVPRLTLRLRVDPFVLRLPLAVQPGGRLGARVSPGLLAARWERSTRARIEGSRVDRRAWPSPLQFAEAEVPTAPPPPPPFARRPAAPPPRKGRRRSKPWPATPTWDCSSARGSR